MLTGENGILKKATTAKEETSKALAEEKVKIAVYGSYNTNGKIDVDELNENYKIKNIYDMAGNVLEWTMEASDTNRRISRGSSWRNSGNLPVSYRDNYNGPEYSNAHIGFRVALYM